MALAALLLAVCPLAAPVETPAWPALEQADWAGYAYEFQPDEAHGDYVIAVEVRAQGRQPNGRLLFNVTDESNYYAVGLTRERIGLVRVESGLALPLGDSVGPGLRPGERYALLLRRHGTRIEVFVDGRRAATAADSTFPGGRVATGSVRGSVEFRDLLVQEMAPVYFEDDFMRDEDETGEWETVRGAWAIQSIGSPVRSTNAFNFAAVSAPKGALAVCGRWVWHDYVAEVSCQPHGPGEIGLVAYYIDPQNHYMFICAQRRPNADGTAQLIRLRNGKRQVLATEPVAVAPGQWHRLGVRVEGRRFTGLLDGIPVVSAVSEGIPCGRAGLYVRGAEGATFDDFVARRGQVLLAGAPDLAAWLAVGGEWQAVQPAHKDAQPVVRAVAGSDARLLFSEQLQGDVSISAAARREGQGEIGLVAGWEDEQNYQMLTYGGEPPALRLVSVEEGQPATRAEAPIAETSKAVELELSLAGRALIGRATGADGLLALASAEPRGRVGLLVRDGEAAFISATVRRVEALPEVAHFESTFAQEVSMADWAAENSDWFTVDAQGADPGPSYWHRAPAYGDQEMSLRMAAPPQAPVSVMLASTSPGAADGYRFTVGAGANGSATLLRGGDKVAGESLPGLAAEGVQEVGLRKHGALIVGYLNQQPTVLFHDPQPLSGVFSGWVAAPEAASPANATFRAENVLGYSFRRAPSDWWIGSGSWKITNRWDCEPRWTFFVGGGEGVACLWNKHEFGPDVTLDFYGAIRFDSTKGYQYPHAANINCTIAADGRDLSSGYSLIYGGWDNQYTRLLRGDEVVAETTEHLIPRSGSIHRRWFNLRLQKAGGHIRCWLDGAQIFEYTDPEPLTGGRAALWTHSNAITLARVRIASSEVRAGPPLPLDAPPRCPYDNPALGGTDE